MGFFSDLINLGPSFALDGLKLDVEEAIDEIKTKPIQTALNVGVGIGVAAAIKSGISTSNSTFHGFIGSPEYDDWIEETGGRDEDYSEYYGKWERRNR